MYFQNEYIDTVQTDFLQEKAIFFNDCEFSFIKIINRKLNYFRNHFLHTGTVHILTEIVNILQEIIDAQHVAITFFKQNNHFQGKQLTWGVSQITTTIRPLVIVLLQIWKSSETAVWMQTYQLNNDNIMHCNYAHFFCSKIKYNKKNI